MKWFICIPALTLAGSLSNAVMTKLEIRFKSWEIKSWKKIIHFFSEYMLLFFLDVLRD